jgi:hypothetical protein
MGSKLTEMQTANRNLTAAKEKQTGMLDTFI